MVLEFLKEILEMLETMEQQMTSDGHSQDLGS